MTKITSNKIAQEIIPFLEDNGVTYKHLSGTEVEADLSELGLTEAQVKTKATELQNEKIAEALKPPPLNNESIGGAYLSVLGYSIANGKGWSSPSMQGAVKDAIDAGGKTQTEIAQKAIELL